MPTTTASLTPLAHPTRPEVAITPTPTKTTAPVPIVEDPSQPPLPLFFRALSLSCSLLSLSFFDPHPLSFISAMILNYFSHLRNYRSLVHRYDTSHWVPHGFFMFWLLDLLICAQSPLPSGRPLDFLFKSLILVTA